jgi:hypothetical protein
MSNTAKKSNINQSQRVRKNAIGVAVSSRLAVAALCLGALLAGCDDGGDATVDPCAVCQADQLCVQINDSSSQCKSSVPTIVCRTVSADCRAMITTDKSCKGATSACGAELCFSPYQCENNAACGNETPKAQLYCYGP